MCVSVWNYNQHLFPKWINIFYTAEVCIVSVAEDSENTLLFHPVYHSALLLKIKNIILGSGHEKVGDMLI